MNIDVFTALEQLKQELGVVLKIKSIILSFQEGYYASSQKSIEIIIFYTDSNANEITNFITTIYDADKENLTLAFIKKIILKEMEKRSIVPLPKSKYSFNTNS